MSIRFKTAELDVNGNVYAVDDRLNLCVCRNGTDTFKRISVSNFGNDPLIDASNPLEIFVFFPSNGKVVIFDNQLNVQQELNIYAGGYLQPAAFGRANDGNIWLIDQNSSTLKKLSRSGDLLNESVILRNFNAGREAGKIYDNGNMVVSADAGGQVFEFNQNLVLENSWKSRGRLIGLEGDKLWFEGSQMLLSRTRPFNQPAKGDTLHLTGDSIPTFRINAGYFLQCDTAALILHAR